MAKISSNMARLIPVFLVALACLLPSAISLRNKQAHNVKAPPPRENYPYYVSASVPQLHNQLYKDDFQNILKDTLFFNTNANKTRSPYQLRTPAQRKREINFRLGNTRVEHKELLEMIQKVIRFSPKATHPFRIDRDSNG